MDGHRGVVHFPNLQILPFQRTMLHGSRDLWAQAFRVRHKAPSVGYTLGKTVQKLKAEFKDTPGHEIGRLRKNGVQISDEMVTPWITFIGDCDGESLRKEHIWESKAVVLECTYVEDEDQNLARQNTHTHLREIADVMREFGDCSDVQSVVLKHFSLRDHPNRIRQLVKQVIPANWIDRVQILLS